MRTLRQRRRIDSTGRSDVWCPVCDANTPTRTLLESRSALGEVLRCEQCELVFVNPLPSDKRLNDYYHGMYESLANSFSQKKMAWALRSLDCYIEDLRDAAEWPKQDFLDLGGGLGYYSRAAREKGLASRLVEMDSVSTSFARDVLGLRDVVEMPILDFLKEHEAQFDLVFLRHVIEHSKDPRTLVARVANVLRPGGALILETDNNDSIEFLLRPSCARFYHELYTKNYKDVSYWKLLRTRPFAADPPRHLFAFNAENLKALLAQSGLLVIRRYSYSWGSLLWPNIPNTSASNVLASLIGLRLRQLPWVALDYLSTPLRIMLARIGWGAGLIVYAKKPQ